MSRILTMPLLFILIVIFNHTVQAKNNSINWQQAKVAVEIDIKDVIEQVRIGVTVFGDYKSDEQATAYKMPLYVTEHIEQIFKQLGINYELVDRTKPSESELSQLKKKAQRKLFKKINEEHLERLKNEGFSDLFVIKFFPQKVNSQRLSMPKLQGYGVYKIPGSHCVYHTLGYIHQPLNGKGKNKLYEVVEEIPEKKKMDHVCVFGRDLKPMGVEWKKDTADYSDMTTELIEKELKNLVLKGILDTYQRHGIIENQSTANKLYIEFTQKDYLVVEKVNAEHFTINEQKYSRFELVEFLKQYANQDDQAKVLVGLQSKSQYTFGDLKELFISVFKDTAIKMYRLGPDNQIIEI